MQTLTIDQMKALRGGVTPEEYCRQIWTFLTNGEEKTERDWANLLGGWDYYNCSQYIDPNDNDA